MVWEIRRLTWYQWVLVTYLRFAREPQHCKAWSLRPQCSMSYSALALNETCSPHLQILDQPPEAFIAVNLGSLPDLRGESALPFMAFQSKGLRDCWICWPDLLHRDAHCEFAIPYEVDLPSDLDSIVSFGV
jgi:hypothetical protein